MIYSMKIFQSSAERDEVAKSFFKYLANLENKKILKKRKKKYHP